MPDRFPQPSISRRWFRKIFFYRKRYGRDGRRYKRRYCREVCILNRRWYMRGYSWKHKVSGVKRHMRRLLSNRRKYPYMRYYKEEQSYLIFCARRLVGNKKYKRVTFYVQNRFYMNFIYIRLISILYIFVLIYIKYSKIYFSKVVYGLWVRYFFISSRLDISSELYNYLYSNVSIFKFYKTFSFEQFFIRGNFCIIGRYLRYMNFRKLFIFDAGIVNKIEIGKHMCRKSIYLYVPLRAGERKLYTTKEKVPCFT